MSVVAETEWLANANNVCARLPWQGCRNHVPYMVRTRQMDGRRPEHVPLVAMTICENIAQTDLNNAQDTNQLATRRSARPNTGKVTTNVETKFYQKIVNEF